jgi:hypothetical protein
MGGGGVVVYTNVRIVRRSRNELTKSVERPKESECSLQIEMIVGDGMIAIRGSLFSRAQIMK